MQVVPSTPAHTSALPRLLLYLFAVMLGGALFSWPLFWLGKTFASTWLPGSSLEALAPARWLAETAERAHFPRYFNRAVLACAVLFIWPLLRSLRVDGALLPSWRPVAGGLRQCALGFALAAGLLLLLGTSFVLMGAHTLRPEPEWLALGAPLGAAVGAGVVEEFFFRALLLGLLIRTFRTGPAVFWTTFIYALVHFLKPPVKWRIADESVTWSSGFEVLGQIARGFGDVDFLLAEFATLFAVGWVLARARLQTGSLWAGIGLHGGWVFGLKYFSTLTRHSGGWLPWIGDNLKIGLLPLLMVLFTGWLALRFLPRQVTNDLRLGTSGER